MKKKHHGYFQKHPLAWQLILLYAAAVAVRYLLALLLSGNPFIAPDEVLYHNIARSILSQGQVLFRGQPVVYENLLYPILLTPLYALPNNIDMYRAIQFYNILLISSAVFPGFLLAKRFLSKDLSTWIAVLFILLLPDMMLGKMLISECVCYPLFYWAVYIAFRAFDGSFRLKDAFFMALLSALLYFTKPGLVAVGPVFCLVFFIYSIRKHKTEWRYAAASLVLLGLFLALLHLLLKIEFKIDFTNTSIYGEQYKELSLANLFVVLQGSVLLLYFFPIACGIMPAILPAAGLSRMDDGRKHFLIMFLTTLLVTIVGVGYIIFLYEWKGTPFAGRIHMRYLAAFIPILLMIALSDRLEGLKLNKTAFVMLLLLFATNLLLTPSASIYTGQEAMDALTLSFFAIDWAGIPMRTVVFILVFLAVPAFAWVLWRRGFTRNVRRITLSVCAALLLINNITGYALLNANTDNQIASDAKEAFMAAEYHTVLFITDNDYHNANGYALDVRFHKPLPTVIADDLAVSMLDSDGTYRPFVPRSYWPTYPDRTTPDADMMVISGSVMNLMELAPGIAQAQTKNGYFSTVPIQKGKPFLKSLMAGHHAGTITAGKVSTILLFPSSKQENRIRLKLRAGINEPGTLVIQTSRAATSLLLDGADNWYEIELPVSSDIVEQIDLSCVTSDVMVFEYETSPVQ